MDKTILLMCDAIEQIQKTAPNSVDAVISSPPYWGLRSYAGVGGEPTPDEYIATLTRFMQEVSRVLTYSGTAWINIGDTYAGYHGSKTKDQALSRTNGWAKATDENKRASCSEYGEKPNNLLLIPFRFAERVKTETGLYFRSNVAWCKPSAKPEKHTLKRPWRSTEYLFQFTKSKSENIFFPSIPKDYVQYEVSRDRNGHPAAMPLKMAIDLVLSCTRPGDLVLDPFMGSGTTGIAALATGRRFMGFELDEKYFGIAQERIEAV